MLSKAPHYGKKGAAKASFLNTLHPICQMCPGNPFIASHSFPIFHYNDGTKNRCDPDRLEKIDRQHAMPPEP
jgi:hypothetical protein